MYICVKHIYFLLYKHIFIIRHISFYFWHQTQNIYITCDRIFNIFWNCKRIFIFLFGSVLWQSFYYHDVEWSKRPSISVPSYFYLWQTIWQLIDLSKCTFANLMIYILTFYPYLLCNKNKKISKGWVCKKIDIITYFLICFICFTSIGSTISRMKEGVLKECNGSRFVKYFHIHTLCTQDIHLSEIRFGFID